MATFRLNDLEKLPMTKDRELILVRGRCYGKASATDIGIGISSFLWWMTGRVLIVSRQPVK